MIVRGLKAEMLRSKKALLSMRRKLLLQSRREKWSKRKLKQELLYSEHCLKECNESMVELQRLGMIR